MSLVLVGFTVGGSGFDTAEPVPVEIDETSEASGDSEGTDTETTASPTEEEGPTEESSSEESTDTETEASPEGEQGSSETSTEESSESEKESTDVESGASQ